jgi:hypothetical protein
MGSVGAGRVRQQAGQNRARLDLAGADSKKRTCGLAAVPHTGHTGRDGTFRLVSSRRLTGRLSALITSLQAGALADSPVAVRELVLPGR